MVQQALFRLCRGILPVVLVLASMTTAQAVPKLVGTYATGNDSTSDFTQHNLLIDDFNTEFSTTLPYVSSYVDRFEGNSFEDNVLSDSDFKFYLQDESATLDFKTVDIFGTTVKFAVEDPPNLGTDNPVRGIEWTNDSTPAPFTYYVSKSGDGWSLWAFMDDALNPVYKDGGDSGADSIVGSGFTIGAIDLPAGAGGAPPRFNPEQGVSHITFLQAGPTTNLPVVPEPASLAIWGIGVAVFGTRYRRHKRS